MSLGFLSISAAKRRLVALTAASALLLAAGNVADATTVPEGLMATDEILEPMTAAEATAATAALAATTPADIAAAFAQSTGEESTVEATTAAPTPARAASLPTLIAAMDDSAATIAADDELRCLANAVYFESRGEPVEGQLAVAQAILNRVDSGRYAGTICGVINQPRQFSFDRTRSPRAGADWRTAQAIALIAARDLWHAMAPKALSFHATYVSPNWRGKTRVAQIGRHVFYR